MPVRNVLVSDSRGHVEHYDAALPLDVVPIAQSTKFLLSRGVPYVETDCPEVRVERERVDLDTESRWQPLSKDDRRKYRRKAHRCIFFRTRLIN